jgi:hypothetical protein
MIITKKAISRRTVLKGLGATIALPFHAMSSKCDRQTAAKPPIRFGAIYAEWRSRQVVSNCRRDGF